MSAPALAGRPSLSIRGKSYPVLLPTIRDPRLHLAAVIITLQVLGQTSFGFSLSIAQILVSLLTAAVLEVAITFRSQRVIMWPASALLTGNGVAFILRVPGTEHGDWWSMNGWWIFAGTAAIALLSKYLIQFRGRHIFNPSNFGLVPCFLLLGPERADPLAFWWGPLSPALVLALAVIVTGGFVILRRLHLTGIAVGFWLSFAAGIGLLAAHRAHDDRGLARRADRGSGILVDARVVARDPRLPLLHDHRPADDPGEPGWPTGVRRRRRAAGDAPDRAVHDRVRDESRRTRAHSSSSAQRGPSSSFSARHVSLLDERFAPLAGSPLRDPSPEHWSSPASSSQPAHQLDPVRRPQPELPRRFPTSRCSTREGSRRSTNRPLETSRETS